MRDVAVISLRPVEHERRVDDRNEVEMLMPVTGEVLGQVDMTIDDIGFTCSGSHRLPGRRGVQLRDRRSTASARGPRSRRATSRWTAPGRSTRPG